MQEFRFEIIKTSKPKSDGKPAAFSFLEFDDFEPELLYSFIPAFFRCPQPSSGEFNGSVIVTVPAVFVVQMIPNDVIDMVSVRRTLVTAVRTMRVLAVMFAAFVLGRAFGGIHLIDRNGMLIDVSLV